jgi:hypothetical protein
MSVKSVQRDLEAWQLTRHEPRGEVRQMNTRHFHYYDKGWESKDGPDELVEDDS